MRRAGTGGMPGGQGWVALRAEPLCPGPAKAAGASEGALGMLPD